MKTFVSAHKLVQIVILIVIGIVINRLLADLAIHFDLPLYLDSVGTIVVAVIGGFSPGAIVGFLTNFIGGFVDSSTFYYGTINVMIAVCAGIAAKRGAFNRITRLPLLLGMLMILSIPCSVLSYFLFDFKIAENVVTPIATALHESGLPVLLSQILADFCTEIPDKFISIIVAYVLIRLTPRWFAKAFDSVSGRSHEDRYRSKNEIHTLKAQVTALLFVSSFALAVAAPLHDIGKINISDVILNKPGKLMDDEFAEMKKHTVYGRDMLVRASKNLGETAYLKTAKEIAYSHHEWWDGSRGYPERLKGKDIPLSARIMAVADVYDALVSERPYKKAFSVDEAIRIITEESGTHFDPEVVDAFVKNRETVEQIMKTKFED